MKAPRGKRMPRSKGSGTSRALSEVELRKRQHAAQVDLGAMLVAKRTEWRFTQQEVADLVSWSQGYYSEIELGKKMTDDVDALIRIADFLDLDRGMVLTKLWEIKGKLALRLPPHGDALRAALIEAAVGQYAKGEPPL